MKGHFCIASLFLVLAGCGDPHPYQAVVTKSETLLVNRYTGKVSTVTNGEVVELPQLTLSERQRVTEPRTYDLGTIPEYPIRFSVKLRFVDGRVLYRLTANPQQTLPPAASGKDKQGKGVAPKNWDKAFDEDRRQSGSRISINLIDDAGFEIREIETNPARYHNTLMTRGKGLGISLTARLASPTKTTRQLGTLDWDGACQSGRSDRKSEDFRWCRAHMAAR
ncbi:MAG TPA: hypothetical protein VJ180_13985, partial [Pyrinomonadaceae bacterium]|nr:hypothetical protein [Pyrinomonadaceae bacterium]